MAGGNTRGWRSWLDWSATIVLVASVVYIALSLWQRDRDSNVWDGGDRVVVGAPVEPVAVDDAPSIGSQAAPLTMIVFSDFQCPYCGAFATDVLPRLKASHVSKGLVKIAFRHLPIKQIHPDAFGAAQAAECSRRQGRFWEMHDLLFGARAPLDPPTVRNHAGAVGLQLDAFDLCMSGDSNLTVERDLRAAEALKLRGTPTFLIGTTQADGRVKIAKTIRGAKSEAAFRETFDRLLDR